MQANLQDILNGGVEQALSGLWPAQLSGAESAAIRSRAKSDPEYRKESTGVLAVQSSMDDPPDGPAIRPWPAPALAAMLLAACGGSGSDGPPEPPPPPPNRAPAITVNSTATVAENDAGAREFSGGVAAGDYDNDGLVDLFVAHGQWRGSVARDHHRQQFHLVASPGADSRRSVQLRQNFAEKHLIRQRRSQVVETLRELALINHIRRDIPAGDLRESRQPPEHAVPRLAG